MVGRGSIWTAGDVGHSACGCHDAPAQGEALGGGSSGMGCAASRYLRSRALAGVLLSAGLLPPIACALAQAGPGGPVGRGARALVQASAITLDTQQALPPRSVSLEERADIFMARKAYADAIDYYHRALKRDPADAALWNKLGIAYQLEMDYRDARKSYKEATHKSAEFPEPWNNLGTTYYLESKYRRAVKYYTHAVELGPTSASFHMNLGAAYSKMRKYPDAIAQYREALQIDPNVLVEHSATAAIVQARGADVEFYFYLAKVFASLARPEDSVRYLRRAMEDGFKDFKRLDEDPDFQKISKFPAYVELRKNLPVAIPD